MTLRAFTSTKARSFITRCLLLLLMAGAATACHKSASTKHHRDYGREAHSPRDTGDGQHSPTRRDWATLQVPLQPSDNQQLYRELQSWLGTPYQYAASAKGQGTDCSGMVMTVYKTVYGKAIERNSARIYEKNCAPIDRDKLNEGDLVFFCGKTPGRITHVGIYLKDGYFVHTSSSRGVMVSNLADTYWNAHYQCAGKVK